VVKVKIPKHARRVYKILGKVPKPRYNITINGSWIGKYMDFHAQRVFIPKEWKTKSKAIAEAKKHLSEGDVEVWECYGSFPEDRAIIWRKSKKR